MQSCYELPLIESRDGPDKARLPGELKKEYDWIVITSPEAAKVFLEAWRAAGQPMHRLATVGKGTKKVFDEAPESKFESHPALQVEFVPSKALGTALAAELPFPTEETRACNILYPASALASKVRKPA